jgi:hypothetical protein
MEEFKNRQTATARLDMALGSLFIVATVAIVAIIVFADIAMASDSTKRLVAFVSILMSVNSWIFTSNALTVFQSDSKDLTAAERETASGSSAAKQPWLVYQIYILAVTVATIVFVLGAIY